MAERIRGPLIAPDRDFAEAMTLSGSKVEAYPSPSGGAEIKNVVVGKGPPPEPPPQLRPYVDLSGGPAGRPIQIVTGAQNVREGETWCPWPKDDSTAPPAESTSPQERPGGVLQGCSALQGAGHHHPRLALSHRGRHLHLK